MGDNRIYFAAGFKSYDITKLATKVDIWFKWVLRSRNLMRRTTFIKETMEWIVFVLCEASRNNGTHMRRWKLKEQFADYFCSRKYNNFGRSLAS